MAYKPQWTRQETIYPAVKLGHCDGSSETLTMGTPRGRQSCPSASRSSEQHQRPAHPASLLSICPLPWVVYWKPASLQGFKALALGTSAAGSRPGGNWRCGSAQWPVLTQYLPPAAAFEWLQTDLPGLQGLPAECQTGTSNKLLVPPEIY